MTFGETSQFAIEIGEMNAYPGYPGLYVQFRFWISGIPIGDWGDHIVFVASLRYAADARTNHVYRLERLFGNAPAKDVFKDVYDGFFHYHYSTMPRLIPNLRDRYHLDGVGMSAIEDKYGVVIVSASESMDRVIAKDLRTEKIVAETYLDSDRVESVLTEYISWGQNQLKMTGN